LELKVYATDLFTHSLKEFSPATTPTVPIAEAVRASMSIPLYYDAWKFSNNNPDDHFYVDGGVLYNYPVAAFDDLSSGVANSATLGFQFENLSASPIYTPFDYGDLGKYLKSLVDTLMYTQSVAIKNSAADLLRTVNIDHLGVSSTDFEIETATKNKLLQSGWDAVVAYLQKQGVDTSDWAGPTLLSENRAIMEVLI
jgi:NTE family protein